MALDTGMLWKNIQQLQLNLGGAVISGGAIGIAMIFGGTTGGSLVICGGDTNGAAVVSGPKSSVWSL